MGYNTQVIRLVFAGTLMFLSSISLSFAETTLSEAVDMLLNVQNLYPATPSGRAFSGTFPDNKILSILKSELNDEQILEKLYTTFQMKFEKNSGRSIRNQPSKMRKQIFKNRVIEVAQHNILAREGKFSYEKGINQFSDMTSTEVFQRYTGYKEGDLDNNFILQHPPVGNFLRHSKPKFDVVEPGDEVNWYAEGAVSPVKNQRGCGSCVFFAVVAALESAHYFRHGVMLDLSEQELLDCTMDYPGYYGCAGNYPETPLPYMHTHGLTSEDNYPYTGEAADNCLADRYNRTAFLESAWRVETYGYEFILKQAVYHWGPIMAVMEVRDDLFSYKKGVYGTDLCKGHLNHMVLVVGYGTDSSGVDYWVIKNSWSSDWGDHGYFRMRRNQNNMCNIASYPIGMDAK